MPSLMRFIAGLMIVAVVGAAAVVSLASFVEPTAREMTIRVPQDRFEGR